jgi:uncharacterized membrane protein
MKEKEYKPLEIDNDVNKETKDDKVRWRTRRKMAWISLFFLILTAYLIFFIVPTDRLEAISPIATNYMYALSAVIGCYVGFSTWETTSKNNNRNKKWSSDD